MSAVDFAVSSDLRWTVVDINERLSRCLNEGLSKGVSISELARELGVTESEFTDRVEQPMHAPVSWLVSLSQRLGIAVEVAMLLTGPSHSSPDAVMPRYLED